MTPRQEALHDLEVHFAEIVESLGPTFDSHQFILRLAQRHQHAYIRALAAYLDGDHPFQFLHGVIAKQLLAHDELVQKTGEHISPNIFGEKSDAAVWERR